jgi:DNA-binding MarR family transcriptional regulator
LQPANPQPTDTDAPARLRSVIGRLSRRLRPTETALAAGLTPTRLAVLQKVSTHGSIRLAELAESEGINPTMLSRVSADLVEAGLLQRASDEGDRRAAWLKATPAGRRLSDRIRKERTDALRLALADLSDAELLTIEKALPALERLAERIR